MQVSSRWWPNSKIWYYIPKSDLPGIQTTLNVADEGQVLSHCQAAENIFQANHTTVYFDGTSRGDHKIIAHQVTLDYETTLGLSTASKKVASTLLETTVKLLEEICNFYISKPGAEAGDLLKQHLSKITSITTDRASVVKETDRKLQDFLSWEVQIHLIFL